MPSAPRSRLDGKAIRLPSGDHVGSPSDTLSFVRRADPRPSASITQMSLGPTVLNPPSVSGPIPHPNAILVPSGDHAGAMSPASLWVSRASPLPSGLTV